MLRGNRSVREALRRTIMMTTVSSLVVACAAFVGTDLATFRRTLESDLTTLADVIAANSAAALVFADHESAEHILSALRARPAIVAARLYEADGKAFASRVAAESPITPPDVAPASGTRFTHRHIEVVRPVIVNGERVGTLFIASDLREIEQQIQHYTLFVASIMLVSMLAAFGLSSLLGKIFSDPILTLSKVADRVRRERDYALRTPLAASAPREVGGLISAFNDMLAEIEQRDAELERHRRDLREEVDARTSELRTANADLIRAKNAAEEIAELNERLGRYKQTILDTAAEGIFGLDGEGVTTFINASAARQLGLDADQLTGRRLHDVVHLDDLRETDWRACDVCSPFLDPPVRAARTSIFVDGDGRTFPIEYTTSTMHGPGVAGVVVTFRDITERLAVDRMKDEFVSTVSHELRTPLTSIRGALGLLGGGLLGPVSERGLRILDIAVTNTDRLVRLINEILDLERMTSGRVELTRKLASAADVMRQAVDVVQNVADRATISIEVEPDHTLLWIDPDRIVQTLTNLLENAVKFSPAGSTVHLSAEKQDSEVTFSIRDRGRGIPSDKLETIFERFKQVNASDSRDKGGSGLGLAISRGIVTAHGGRLWAESKVGEGSVFRLSIPMARGRNDDLTPLIEGLHAPGQNEK